MRFFTSDTHFGHKNIIKYSNRPFDSVEHMNEMLIHNWNQKVGDTDVVFHLGDVAMGDSNTWNNILTRLNGYKILVVGNHDRIFAGEKERQRQKWDEQYHAWFDEVYDNLRGEFLDDGTIVDMSHFPYDGDSHDGDRYTQFRLKDMGRTLIHGHTHAEGEQGRVSKSKRGAKMIHVGVDSWNYAPVSEDEVIALINS